MESRNHRRLKQLSIAFLRENGCQAAATEVRCPISRFRVDVAGYVDTLGSGKRSVTHETSEPRRRARRSHRQPGRTVLIECKQTRADFLRDRRDTSRLLELRADLDRLRRSLEEKRIKADEPHLRRTGSSLFAELEEWDFASSRLPAYRELIRRMRQIDRKLHGETKFCLIARYALADRLYIACPRGLIKKLELPPGWGLLECSAEVLKGEDPNADLFGESLLRVAVKAPMMFPREEHRQRLLRNIAVAASWTASSAIGVLA